MAKKIAIYAGMFGQLCAQPVVWESATEVCVDVAPAFGQGKVMPKDPGILIVDAPDPVFRNDYTGKVIRADDVPVESFLSSTFHPYTDDPAMDYVRIPPVEIDLTELNIVMSGCHLCHKQHCCCC